MQDSITVTNLPMEFIFWPNGADGMMKSCFTLIPNFPFKLIAVAKNVAILTILKYVSILILFQAVACVVVFLISKNCFLLVAI